MFCKLCLQNKVLSKKSHIIPTFLYSSLFDEQHKIFKVDLKRWKMRGLQTGEFEPNILCLDCENKLSKFETYAKTILYGGRTSKKNSVLFENQINQNGVEFVYAKGLNYQYFKLFLLSILWKSSISSRPFFKRISLETDEEMIRCMLLEEDPGKPHSYPCVMSTYRRQKLPPDFIGEPRTITKNKEKFCIFLINTILYYFYINSKITESWILETAINEEGELRLIHMPIDHSKNIFNSFFGKNIF